MKEVAQSCPTLGDPMDCSLPGSSIHGIFQARVLEWGAIAFSVQISLLTANTDSPLRELTGLGLAGLGLRSSLFSVSYSRAQAEGAVAAWVYSYDGQNEQKDS